MFAVEKIENPDFDDRSEIGVFRGNLDSNFRSRWYHGVSGKLPPALRDVLHAVFSAKKSKFYDSQCSTIPQINIEYVLRFIVFYSSRN